MFLREITSVQPLLLLQFTFGHHYAKASQLFRMVKGLEIA